MKKYFIFSVVALTGVLWTPSAHALSCLPTDAYLADVVGKEEIVIFTGRSIDRIDEEGYTAEVLKVSEGLQGYVEEKIFVYHEKTVDWGYLCNAGPKEEGTEGVYVTSRDAYGKYNVYQRLDVNDPLVKNLKDDLEEASVTGGVSELSSTDRKNQIITTITDIFVQIGILLKEYAYWKSN